MADIEVALTDLGELATRELIRSKKPVGMDENIVMAKAGGKIAKNTRKDLENALGRSVISTANALKYKYLDDDVKEMK